MNKSSLWTEGHQQMQTRKKIQGHSETWLTTTGFQIICRFQAFPFELFHILVLWLSSLNKNHCCIYLGNRNARNFYISLRLLSKLVPAFSHASKDGNVGPPNGPIAIGLIAMKIFTENESYWHWWSWIASPQLSVSVLGLMLKALVFTNTF